MSTLPHATDIRLGDILITRELARRMPRPRNAADYRTAVAALGAKIMAHPRESLAALVDLTLQVCDCGSAGLSVLTTTGDGESIFRWDAMAGVYRSFVGGTTPRKFSPCGVTLDRNSPQLFDHPGRYFTYFNAVEPQIVEGLVMPIVADGIPLGTLWIVSHDDQRKFDSGDVSAMESLVYFSTATLRHHIESNSSHSAA